MPLVAVACVAVLSACSGGSDDDARRSRARATTTTTTRPASISRVLPTTMESPPDLPGYHVFRPADLDAVGGPAPVVVWANGGCLRYDTVWQPLLERWAAAGFVVVSIAAPPDGVVDRAALSTAADQARAIDWAAAHNDARGDPYSGRLDLDRVVAAGNSCGGITTMALAATDPRVRATFVLSGSGAFPGTPVESVREALRGVSVPVAYAVGGPEDIARTFAGVDYEVLPDGVPAYIASRAAGDHPTVSTTREILVDEVAPIGVQWFDLVLYGREAALRALVDAPCPACASAWSVQAKHLETLVA